jgi:hypothetical protein
MAALSTDGGTETADFGNAAQQVGSMALRAGRIGQAGGSSGACADGRFELNPVVDHPVGRMFSGA